MAATAGAPPATEREHEEQDANLPTLSDVRAAAARIAPYLRPTPILSSRSLSALVSERLGFPVELRFKCEIFQRGGAFKARGAVNAVFALSDEEAARGVVTHSSGNHAAALALAASLRGIPAYIVIPRTAPECKLRATQDAYGGKVFLCEPTLAARESAAQKLQQETGAAFIPPYDHKLVAAGQGTLALEMLTQEDGEKDGGDGNAPLDALVVPVSGGGMLSGCAVAARGLRGSSIAVIGAEPKGENGVADAKQCLESGQLIKGLEKTQTIADGLQANLGPRVTWPVIRRNVDGVLTCAEHDLVEGMRLVAERMKLVVEPSGACGLACLVGGDGGDGFGRLAERHPALKAAVDRAKRGEGAVRIGVVLCGGNVDMEWFRPEWWKVAAA
jgi:serine racemase